MTLEEWVAARHPAVPADFAEWANPRDGSAPASTAALVSEAKQALALAESPEGRPRGGAFDLLAADGFVTWACEAALEEPDVDEALQRVLDALME